MPRGRFLSRYKKDVGDGSVATIPWNYTASARVLRAFAWTQIAVPAIATIVTIPASLVLIMFGGIIIVAPPIALGVVGLGISKGLRHGHRRVAAAVLALVHAGAYAGLALHSRTWDPRSLGEANFYLLAQVVFWVAVIVNVGLLFMLAAPARVRRETPEPDAVLDLAPPLWPWLLAGALVLALIALGIAVPMTG